MVPGLPHHVVQRGARRLRTFFSDDDYATYRQLLGEACQKAELGIWAYCLMPNHVHLIAVPKRAADLARAIGETHRRYAWRINRREEATGHLWQARFASFAMDTPHLMAAARYIELNPVSAGLVTAAERWPWSSARAHLAGRDDRLVSAQPLNAMVPDWAAFLGRGSSPDAGRIAAEHERTGFPLGSDSFVAALEAMFDRSLRPVKRGPKPGKARAG